MEKDYLGLYSLNCLKCKHLIPEATKKFKCTPDRNSECPAAEVQITIVGKAKVYAQRLLKARKARDTEKELSILAIIEKESEGFKSKFYDYLESLGKGKE